MDKDRQGIQIITLPKTGEYEIVAYGAANGFQMGTGVF